MRFESYYTELVQFCDNGDVTIDNREVKSDVCAVSQQTSSGQGIQQAMHV
jgi:hypothetical protein